MSANQTALILDGSLTSGCVALLTVSGSETGTLKVAEVGAPPRGHLERAASLLPTATSRAGLVAVVIGVGPGSYTGIRAASAAAAGIAAALNLPIVQIESDRALLYAASEREDETVAIPLGTREMLLIRKGGSEILPQGEARASADLGRVAERLPQAFANLAASALRDVLSATSRGEVVQKRAITLRYPSPPRGVEGRGGR